GTIAAFLQYTRSFSQPVSMISQLFNSILNALAGAERIFETIDQIPEIDKGRISLVNACQTKTLVQSFAYTGEWAWKDSADNSLKKLSGKVVFDHVNFGYKAEKEVLHDICINAKPGMKIALVGSTGSGKTTVINLLSRFYDVPEEKGCIYIDDIPVNSIKKDDLRRSLGLVLQDTHLFSGSVFDNIKYGNLDASRHQIIEAAKLANAHNFIEHLENGYDTILSGDASSLSQGQRQLLAIARTALKNPPILILDEATSSIDTRTERLIQEGMDKLMEGRTSFVIAHRLSTVRNADEILVFEKGRIIERGNHESLLAQKGRYWELNRGNSKAR
ncbi:MAG: ATP-binding cassette domain-containing protein, partial [Treponema sp.]|nr:ATP-binding cassette domain-containing protein [Treponema sp.]